MDDKPIYISEGSPQTTQGNSILENCVVILVIGQMMRRCLLSICTALISAEDELNQLDRGSGDGDCGSTLKPGAEGKSDNKTEGIMILKLKTFS